MFYPMLADVYFSTSVQKPSGAMEDTWVFDRSVPCELKTGSFNTEMRYALQTFDEFFMIPTIIYGRFKEDIQVDSDGKTHDLTETCVSRLRTNNSCGGPDQLLFTEHREDEDGQFPTVYEVRSLSPFINPWGRPEHFKTQLFRSDNQEMKIT